MTHICVDARMIQNSGIGVYIHYYVDAILEAGLYEVTLMGRHQELYIHFGKYNNWKYIKMEAAIYTIQEQILLPYLIPSCDVFWSPHYNVPLLPIRAKKHIVTIPDIFHLAFSDTLNVMKKIYAHFMTNVAVRKPDIIITISNFSKLEITRLTNVKLSKIQVIYLGLDREIFKPVTDASRRKEVSRRYDIPKRFILFVGNVKPNKNLNRLVDAFRMLSSEVSDVYLVIAGKKDGFITGDPGLFNKISQDDILKTRIRFTGFVRAEDLPSLYSMAEVFAFPSIYEGFGFPPLEAMACECPVLASNAASIPEVCGEAAEYVDPMSAEDISTILGELLLNKKRKEELVNYGKEQVEKFTWNDSSIQFLKAVDSLLNHTK